MFGQLVFPEHQVPLKFDRSITLSRTEAMTAMTSVVQQNDLNLS